MPIYELEQVFNEATYPEITFVEPQEYPFLKSAFRAVGKHITVTGPSGSGKTTLISHLLRDMSVPQSELFTVNARAYVDATSCFDIFATELAVGPTFDEVTPFLQSVRFIILDDFHHLSLKVRLELAQHLKLWHEKNVRFILIGIASSSKELVGADPELAIRNEPFDLRTQKPEFIRRLISLGEIALNIRFSEVMKTDICDAANGVPSVVQAICRTACISEGIEGTIPDGGRVVDRRLRDLHDSVLRVFHVKYFDKVLGLAKGKQQARSVHNTYFDIINEIAKLNQSEIPVELLRGRIVNVIKDPKERSRKSTSFYNCLSNLSDVIQEKGLGDVMIYNGDSGYISIEDPSFRFYLNLLDMTYIAKNVAVRHDVYPYDIAVSFAGEDRAVAYALCQECKKRGLFVFYDFDRSAQLWGKDLSKTLADVYANQAIFMVIFISKHYPQKDWTNFELEIGKIAAEKRSEEYLLPVRVDETAIVGMKGTVAYVPASKGAEEIAQLLETKVNEYAGD